MKYLLFLFYFPILVSNIPIEKSNHSFISETINDSFAVIQLFTSQGCSSCPSADRLLEKVKNDYAHKNVVVLSYHVDYWNHLGWKDPFSKNDFTLKQDVYGFVFGSRSNYTPQAVINGKLHFVGSNEDKMNKTLSKILKKSANNTIAFTGVSINKNKISFSYNVLGDTKNKELKIALVIDKRETPINKGENGGRVLINRNIVVEEIIIPIYGNKSKAGQIEIPKIVNSLDKLRIIGYIQKKDYSITGATQSKLMRLH